MDASACNCRVAASSHTYSRDNASYNSRSLYLSRNCRVAASSHTYSRDNANYNSRSLYLSQASYLSNRMTARYRIHASEMTRTKVDPAMLRRCTLTRVGGAPVQRLIIHSLTQYSHNPLLYHSITHSPTTQSILLTASINQPKTFTELFTINSLNQATH